MKIDKTKLIQDIEDMREKLASMEKELNKPDEFKHFPSKGEVYFYYLPFGEIDTCHAKDDKVRPYVYKTEEDAQEAYNKAVALEKIKRRLLELQGDWKPDFNANYVKYFICYNYNKNCFEVDVRARFKYHMSIPYIKTSDITNTIINEYHSELKIIFDIT